MAMKEIPDVRYEVSEDGETLMMEQGYDDPSRIHLRRMQVEYFANLMKLDLIKETEASPSLVCYLESIHDQAKNLFNYLVTVPTPPGYEEESEDITLARDLLKTANVALGFWGNN